MIACTLTLPYPPSANRYWRHNRGRTHISAEGRAFRAAVAAAVTEQQATGTPPLTGRLAVALEARMPDHRRRDLDNLLKATLDALTHAGVWQDDCQIDRLTLQRGPVTPPGCLILTIQERCQ